MTSPGGHRGHGDHAAVFRDRFWLTLILTVPVVVYSHMLQRILGYTAPSFPGSDWVSPCLAPSSSATALLAAYVAAIALAGIRVEATRDA